MPRVYAKKPNALREKVTVPLSPESLERLKAHALSEKKTHTAAARDLIENNIPKSEPAK